MSNAQLPEHMVKLAIYFAARQTAETLEEYLRESPPNELDVRVGYGSASAMCYAAKKTEAVSDEVLKEPFRILETTAKLLRFPFTLRSVKREEPRRSERDIVFMLAMALSQDLQKEVNAHPQDVRTICISFGSASALFFLSKKIDAVDYEGLTLMAGLLDHVAKELGYSGGHQQSLHSKGE